MNSNDHQTTNNLGTLSTDAAPKTKIHKRIRLLCLFVTLCLASAPLVAAVMAAFLKGDEGKLKASVAFPLGGESSYIRVADSIGSTVNYAGLMNSRPNRLVERGLIPSRREGMIRKYDELGVPEEAFWEPDIEVVGLTELLEALEVELRQDSNFSCAFVVNCYHYRQFRDFVNEVIAKPVSSRVHIVTTAPYDFSIWNWWLDSHGRRTIITGWINYLAFHMSDRTERDDWHIRTQQEFRNAAIKNDAAG